MDLLETLGLKARHVEDDAVLYAVYPDCTDADLSELKQKCMRTLAPFLDGYIWQRDALLLHTSTDKQPVWHQKKAKQGSGASPSQTPCLWGVVRFGDNIEDEWFIVWLLMHLTSAVPGISARVWDNDGEFLLIEAADALPKWLKPDTSTNRVWLRGGRLHVIPLRSSKLPTLPASPTLEQALQILKDDRSPTESPRIEAPIAARLRGYPDKARQQMHRALCHAPARVVYLLHKQPQLASAAAEAFYCRDPDDMRLAMKMQHFPPVDMVTSAVTLNRCSYAQLQQQQFQPPKRYAMPLLSDPAHKAADLGLKLTTGFEILYGRDSKRLKTSPPAAAGDSAAAVASTTSAAAPATSAAARTGGTASPVVAAAPSPTVMVASDGPSPLAPLSEEDVQHLPAWNAFKASLQASDYFRGNLEGSAEYRRLLAQALRNFAESDAYGSSARAAAAPGQTVQWLLAEYEADKAAAVAEIERNSAGVRADDDSWMEEQAAELDRFMKAQEQQEGRNGAAAAPSATGNRGGEGPTAAATARAAPAAALEEELDAAELAGKFSSFVNLLSSYEGAEAPGDAMRDVGFEPGSFLSELERALGLGGAGTPQVRATAGGGPDFGIHVDNDDDFGMGCESSDEGSSFFGSGSSSGGGSDEEMDDAGDAEVDHNGSHNPSGAASTPQLQPAAAAAAVASALVAPVKSPAAAGGPAADRLRGRAVASGSAADADMQDAWSVQTATDSDDEEECAASVASDEAFMDAYSTALADELGGTSMGVSFERAATANEARQAPSGGPPPAAPPTGAELGELQPIDVDINLVKSLLESYTSQQGLPGPASNLAGLLGLQLGGTIGLQGRS